MPTRDDQGGGHDGGDTTEDVPRSLRRSVFQYSEKTGMKAEERARGDEEEEEVGDLEAEGVGVEFFAEAEGAGDGWIRG